MVKERSTRRLGFVRSRAALLPWRRIGIGFAVVVALLVTVAPLRRAAALGPSRVILWLASPITPFVPDFDSLESTRVLAAEDAEFYHHSGTNPLAIVRAVANTVTGDTQGGSTITQQLAKINYTGNQRSLFRKAREVFYASALEERYSKDELLQRYLNQVYFGEGAYGIYAAAHSYFGVDPAQLTPAQAAMLAGKIQAPSRLDPRQKLDEVLERRNHVLRAMERHGWLVQTDLDTALGEQMNLAPPQPPGVNWAPHFVDFIKREASRLDELGDDPETRATRLTTGGYTVETTLDPKLSTPPPPPLPPASATPATPSRPWPASSPATAPSTTSSAGSTTSPATAPSR